MFVEIGTSEASELDRLCPGDAFWFDNQLYIKTDQTCLADNNIFDQVAAVQLRDGCTTWMSKTSRVWPAHVKVVSK